IHHLIVSPDQTKVYIGGDFTKVGATPRTRLAAVDMVIGVPTAWAPAPPAMIQKLAVSGDGTKVYAVLGGKYGVGNRLQAWSTLSSSTTPRWEVTGDGDFQAVAVSNSLVYAGGHFNFLYDNSGSTARRHLAAF